MELLINLNYDVTGYNVFSINEVIFFKMIKEIKQNKTKQNKTKQNKTKQN